MEYKHLVPTIVRVTPNLTTAGVPVRPEIRVLFSTEVSAALAASAEELNKYIILVEESSDSAFPVEPVSYDSRNLVFTPQRDLSPGKMYQITFLRGLADAAGRALGAKRSFAFKVGDTLVGKPVLVSPADSVSVTGQPLFTWLSVSVSGSPSGSLEYLLEVDRESTFHTVDTLGWSTYTSDLSAIPYPPLPEHQTYWWRVTGIFTTDAGSAVTGPQSDPRVFYLGTFAEPSPDSAQTFNPDPKDFYVVSASWEDGDSNRFHYPSPFTVTFNADIASGSVWDAYQVVPSVPPVPEEVAVEDPPAYQFCRAPSGTLHTGLALLPMTVTGALNSCLTLSVLQKDLKKSVRMRREPVDGPKPENPYVAITVTVTGSVLEISPHDPILPNSRYTVEIDGLTDLEGNKVEKWESYFTSRYNPLYCSATTLRADFGRFLIPYPDDLINFHIHRVSMEANRHAIAYYSFWGGPTQEMVRNLAIPLTFPMEKWVEAQTAVKLLTMRLYEEIESADKSKRLGDYQEEAGADLIGALEGEIKRLSQEAAQWLPEFSRKKSRIRTVEQSERYPTGQGYWGTQKDRSFDRFKRGKF